MMTTTTKTSSIEQLIFRCDLVTKILFLASALLLCVNLITVFGVEENRTYNFVKCPDDTNTYPEGTKCDLDQDIKMDTRNDVKLKELQEKYGDLCDTDIGYETNSQACDRMYILEKDKEADRQEEEAMNDENEEDD